MIQAFLSIMIGLLVWLSFPKAFADRFNRETSFTARGLAMGNAVINTERGGNSVFYNPANIAAKNTGRALQLTNIQIEGSEGFISQRPIGILNLSQLYTKTLLNHPNTLEEMRLSLYPNFTIRNLSLGLLYEINQGAEVRASDGAVHVVARNRFAPTAALSFRFMSGILRLGVSAQLLTVGNANSTTAAPASASSLNYATFIDAGTGLSKNAGVTVSLPFRYLPSFSLVARDIGNTTFSTPLVKFGNGRNTPSAPMTFDLASSLVIYAGRGIEWRNEFDYRDLINKSHGSQMQHASIGSEFLLFNLISLRAGIAHGYLSGGFGIGSHKSSLDFAAYTDELDDRLRSREDHRFVLQYRWGTFER